MDRVNKEGNSLWLFQIYEYIFNNNSIIFCFDKGPWIGLIKKEFLCYYSKFYSFNATVKMSQVPFWWAIRRLSSKKVLPFTNVTYTQKGDHLACSAKTMSLGTQSRSPMSQWKHVVISQLPVTTVFDASENVFDKSVSRKSVFCATVCIYIYMYLEKRSPPLPKIRVMALPPYVSTCRKMSLASNRL